ncbi:MAG: hypothetical protein J6L58_00770 [Clostridia bacterium]|nr:hypothetical protein [Clostridia bacterium]
MDFRKKLRTRLYLAISYIVIGAVMIAASFITKTTNEFVSSFGFALLLIGIVRIRNHFIITKNDETIKKQEIAETDERNISIANRAKSLSFTLYVFAASITVIVLQILEMGELASVIGFTVCALIIIYWISYFIIRKKS